MREQYPTPEQALVADIQQAIAGPQAELQSQVYEPGLRTIVEAAFPLNPLMDGSDDIEANIQRSFANGEVDNPESAFNRTELSYFVAEIFGAMTSRLLDAYPAAPDQDDNDMSNLLKPFRQGHEKLLRVVATENPDLKDIRAAEYLTPVLLASLAGYAADYQAAEDTEAAQRRLQMAAERIMDGGNLAVQKNMRPEDEIFGRLMSMLGVLYHRGSNIDFYTRFIAHDYEIQLEVDPSLRIDPKNVTSKELLRTRQMVSDRIAEHNKAFGITVDTEDVLVKYLASSAGPQRRKRISNDLDTFLNTDSRSRNRRQAASAKESERLASRREDFIIESQRVLVARNMIHLMAEGSFDYHSLGEFSALMTSQPLKERVPDIEVPEQLVEWEIAPPAIGQGDPRGACAGREQPGEAAGWDMARKEKMDEYVRMWGAPMGQEFGQGRTARSRIPNLKEAEQYYLAILPQRIGNVIIEHAIADNPSLGRHAVYVWRAEDGLGRHGQVQLNWERVFSQHKKIMQRLGARRMLHSPTLENKILDFLTRPEDKLRDPRYYY